MDRSKRGCVGRARQKRLNHPSNSYSKRLPIEMKYPTITKNCFYKVWSELN